MAPAIPAPARDTAQEAGLSQSFWQQAAELGALDEQHRLAAIEQGWSSRGQAALDLAASERLDRLMEALEQGAPV